MATFITGYSSSITIGTTTPTYITATGIVEANASSAVRLAGGAVIESTLIVAGTVSAQDSTGILSDGGDTVHILPTGVVHAYEGSADGIISSVNGSNILVDGQIIAEDYGIFIFSAGSADVIIGQNGIVRGGSNGTDISPSSAAIYMGISSQSSLVNHGTIIADQNSTSGLSLAVVSAPTTSAGAGFDVLGISGLRLVNTGMIQGQVLGGGDTDTVTNSGEIHGNVNLASGDDIYNGSGGQVFGVIQLDSGDDTLYGGDFGDNVSGSGGEDRIYTYGGDDLVFGGDNADFIDAGEGADTLSGGNGDDTIHGRDHDDYVEAGNGADLVYGQNGSDTLEGDSGEDTLRAGAGDDYVAGGSNADIISGGSGDDTILGDSGADYISGDSGDDSIMGGTSFDTILGGSGDDTINGEANADDISGGSGDDLLRGDTGSDTLGGGSGDDTISAGTGNDRVAGGSGNDRMFGGSDSDTVTGAIGDDYLDGGLGDDSLGGGSGDDTLIGGDGRDTLRGGSGADVFEFNSASDSPQGSVTRDLIVDFEAGIDTLDLSGFSGTLTFIGGTAFSGTANEARYNAAIGRFYVDTDGNGTSDFAIDMTGNPAVTADDLIL